MHIEHIDPAKLAPFVGVTAGLVAAVLAGFEYRASNRWRKADSLASLMKAWRENPINQNAMHMLDTLSVEGRGLRVDFGTAAEKYGAPRYVALEPDTILAALWTAEERPDPAVIGPERWGTSQLIRETLEFFFNELSHMNRYIKSGLYPSKDIRPYLKWYVGILGGSDRAASPAARARIRAYLQSWGFEDVLDLIARARRERWSRRVGTRTDPR
jgi:hypothetical protein